MDLVVLTAYLFALEEFSSDVRIAGCRDKGREPVHTRKDTVFDLARRYLARPAQQRWDAEAAFQSGALASGERGIAAVRPSEVLRAVVSGEDDDSIVVDAHVLELRH